MKNNFFLEGMKYFTLLFVLFCFSIVVVGAGFSSASFAQFRLVGVGALGWSALVCVCVCAQGTDCWWCGVDHTAVTVLKALTGELLLHVQDSFLPG